MSELISRLPIKGQYWEHTKTGYRYLIVGAGLDVVTDKLVVVYEPQYASEFERFTRPMKGHPKAWLVKNDDGSPRFKKIADNLQELLEQ